VKSSLSVATTSEGFAMHFVRTIAFVGVSVLLSVVSRPQGKEIRLAAAADLKFAMDEMVADFEKQTGTSVLVTYGSSGNFFSQIQNGAPFDVFFSADVEYPRKLEAAGLAEPVTLYEYALGRLVIWTPADSKLDFGKLGWKILLDASVQKIAIANPDHAPYGRAAVAALEKAGIYESVKGKLVYGENISQAAQFVQSGNAQAGIIALSLAVSPAMRGGKQWEIPENMHPAIVQGAIVLKNAKEKEAARTFLNYARSETGRATLAKYGFEFPASANSSMPKP
jgi:molybdate transport system substrate-binding protein